MEKIFVICGHGAGDSGACGNGYQEQERVRALGQRIKDFGGSNVLLGDMSRNYYADNGISKLSISKDYQIIELHMDANGSSQPHGAHVIIKGGLNADQYDKNLEAFLAGMFPGRSSTLVGRSDLANPARAYAKGYAYRLVEIGFITNPDDVNKFNSNIDEIAKGILNCFGTAPAESKPVPTPTPKPSTSIEDVARDVIKGKYGNGQDRKNNLANAGYDYGTVQSVVNTLLNGGSGSTPKPSKSNEDIAREVIRGDWGNGQDRKNNLANAGYDYGTIQAIVNRLL